MNEVEIRVGVDDDTRAGLASVTHRVRGTLRDIEKSAKGEGGKAGDKWARSFASFIAAGLKPGAVAIATGFSAQIVGAVAAGLASGAVKVAQGAGAMLALLPAVALAGGLALGTLKLALVGVGDALKAGLAGDTEKFNEAIKGMAPSAQQAMREVVGLKGQIDSLKQTVQGNFFQPLIGQIKPLGEIYLRQAHLVMGDLARSMGQAANQVSNFLRVPSTFRAIYGASQDAKTGVTNLIRGLGGLLQAFLPLVTVGASFLPGLTEGFGGATARLASFMREAERTGQLREFIQRGIDAIKSLIDTGAQLVRIFRNLGEIGRFALESIGAPAGTLLDKIEALTEKAVAFLQTGAGESALGNIMGLLGGLATAMLGTLQKLGEILAPIMPQLIGLVTAFAELKFAILDALAPAVAFIGAVLLPALTSLMSWLADNKPVLQAILVSLFTLWAIHAGIAAAATIAATWPFILLGAVIAAFALLVITHWGTISRVTKAVTSAIVGFFRGAIDWLRRNWPLVLAILTGPIGLAVLAITRNWGTIKSGFTAVKDWIAARVNNIVSFITGIPGRISHAAGFVGTLIKRGINSARDWVKEQVNRIINFITSIPGRLGNIGGRIRDKILGGIGDIGGAVASKLNPANWFAHGGVTGAQGGGPRGGLTMVGEHGRELVRLPAGSRVHGNAMTEGMLAGAGAGGGTTFNVYVAGSIRSDRDLVRLIRDEFTRGGFGGAFG